MIYLCLALFFLGIGFCLSGLLDLQSHRWHRVVIVSIKFLNVLLMLCGLILVAVLFFVDAISQGFDGMCAETVMQVVPSPHERNIAYILTRDCGAVTNMDELHRPIIMLRDSATPAYMSTEGSIIPRKDWLGRSIRDDVFAGDFHYIEWLSDTHLKVSTYSGQTETAYWQDVTISYTPQDGSKSTKTKSVKKKEKSRPGCCRNGVVSRH